MKFIQLFVFLFAGVAVAQQLNQDVTNSAVFGSSSNSLGLFQADETSIVFNAEDLTKINGVASITDFSNWSASGEITDGSVYLLDDWAAKGYVVTGDKQFVFPKMNYDVQRGAMVSKFSKDSIFNIGRSGYDMIMLEGLVFKPLYNPARGGNVMYQVIYEGPDYSIVKEFSLEIREADPNPMVNRKRRKITKKEHYFLMKGSKFEKFRPSKKSISELAGDKSKDLMAYAKKAKWSVKKDADLVKILDHLYAGN